MRNLQIIFIGLFIISAFFSSIVYAELVHLQEDGMLVENGKILKMDFREVERQRRVSTIYVTFESGGSVSSSMFILKGFCAIAESRKVKFFRQISESLNSAGSRVYKVEFFNKKSNQKDSGPHVLADTSNNDDEGIVSLEDCRLLRRVQVD